jgi:hypothetical protein
MMEGTTSVLSDPIRPKPPLASTDSTKPPWRPRKVKPRPSNPARPEPSQSRLMAISLRLQHTFKTTPLQAKSTKACLRSASHVGSATKLILSSWRRSHVWSAAEAPPTPITSGSLSPERWAARSATNSLYLYAEPITETTTTPATKSPGGRGGLLIPSPRLGCSGSRRGVSNEGRIKSRFLPVGPRSPAARITPRITGPTVGDNARRPCKFQSRGVSIH